MIPTYSTPFLDGIFRGDGNGTAQGPYRDDWQRLDDFCREIGRSCRSGKNYCDQGLVEWSRLGNQIFIKRSSVGRLLEGAEARRRSSEQGPRMKPQGEPHSGKWRASPRLHQADTAAADQPIGSEWSASASDQTDIEVPPEGLMRQRPVQALRSACCGRDQDHQRRSAVDRQTRKGKASAKSSGWRSRHFCRSPKGLQLALRRMLGRDGVPADVVRLISALPEWHQPEVAELSASFPIRPFAESGIRSRQSADWR